MTREEFRALLDEKVLICDGPLGAIFEANEAAVEAEPARTAVDTEADDYLAEDEDLFEDGELLDGDETESTDDETESTDEETVVEASAPPLPELLALEDKQRLTELHMASIEAGADIILTNTFAANGPTLAALDLEEKLEAILTRSIAAARDAVEQADLSSRRKPLIGFVMGPLAPGMTPTGPIAFAEAMASYQEVAMAAEAAGIDLFVLDAIPDLQMLRAALIAIAEAAPEIPVIVQMAFGRDGRSESRTSPAAACAVCRSLGADAIGAAGNLLPDEMLRVVTAFNAVSDLPLICQPMATSEGFDGETRLAPKEFATKMEAVVDKGVSIIGCWCATKPHYVAYLRRMSEGKKPQNPERAQRLILSSRSRDIEIGGGRGLVMIKSWDEISRLATRGAGEWQHEALRRALAPARRAGAQMFEIRQATPGLDEPEFFQRAMPIIQEVGDMPVFISADTRKGLEEALRCSAGRPLINAVWLDKDRLERILPLARKYGAAVVAVSMRGDQAPGGAEDRVAVMEELLQEIVSGGLRQEDIIVDPIMTSLDQGPDELMEVIKTLSLLKERLGQPTLLKLSRLAENIEGRAGVDAAFVAMAMTAGLDAAVGDFHEPVMWQAGSAASLIMGRDPEARRYGAFVRAQEKAREDAQEQQEERPRYEGRSDRSRDESDSRPRRDHDRPRSSGGYGDRSRPQQGGGGGSYGDRGGRPQSSGGGSYGDRGGRPQSGGGGSYGDRGGRPQSGGGGSYGDRGGRPQSGGGGSYGDRGGRPQSGGGGSYGDRGRPQSGGGGSYGDRGRSFGANRDRDRKPTSSGDYYRDRERSERGGGYRDDRRPQGGNRRPDHRDSDSRERSFDKRSPRETNRRERDQSDRRPQRSDDSRDAKPRPGSDSREYKPRPGGGAHHKDKKPFVPRRHKK